MAWYRMRAALLCLLLACTSDRARDCSDLHDLLATSTTAVRDERAFATLREHAWRDPEVAAAVTAFVDETGWTLYAPYRADHPAAGDRLAKLCPP
jgi:hypothetical protein